MLAFAGLAVVQAVPASAEGPAADVAVDVSSRATGATGEVLHYKTEVVNNGPDAAPVLVTVAPDHPPYATITTSTGTCGALDAGTSVATCDLGTLPSGATALVRVQVPLTTPGSVPFAATVTTSATDADSTNDTENVDVAVDGPACTVVGTAAGDTLSGTAAADTLCGFGGADELAGLSGNDHLLGGTGNDIAVYAAAAGPVVADLEAQTSNDKTAAGDSGSDVLHDVEGIEGTRAPDTLNGSLSRDVLTGKGGSDVIRGHGGDDTLQGNGGNDTIVGGDGTDRCSGSTGANTITECEPWLRITSVNPSPMVPGASATIVGEGFSGLASDNAVTIGGVAAPVTSASPSSLTVTVPCVGSGSRVPVKATVFGKSTNAFRSPLHVPYQRDLAVGESLIITDPSEVGCNELTSAEGEARYVLAAYNTSTNPTTSNGIQLASDSTVDEPLMAPDAGGPGRIVGSGTDWATELLFGKNGKHVEHVDGHSEAEEGDAHLELLKSNREQYKLLAKEFGTEGVEHPEVLHDVVATDLPMTRTFRVPNIVGANYCNSFYVGSGTRVYAEGKLVIYEDDATPEAFKAANNAAMADYYDKIGDQFNADMEPIVSEHFGDVLRRDPVTDNNGVLIAIATPRINNSFSGVAGFVVSCDQFPNDDTNTPGVGGPYVGTGSNGASNFGEYFYVYQPNVNNTGYVNGLTPDNWYRTVRSTFIHETKHVASMAARTANAAPYESGWLEEGTARLAEELWARESVYNVPWKGNTGYGSAESPNSIWCDVRPGFAQCDNDNPLRPANVMNRHFGSLYTYLAAYNSRLLSPFGPTPNDNQNYYYATSWSLVRYAIDRYGASDADFLTALTDSSSTGVTNLSERTGVTTEELLGRWALALSVDDYPGLTGASEDLKMPTWNMRDIYAGYNQDFSTQGSFTSPYPSVPENLTFGAFTPVNVPVIRGGGVRMFQLSGTQTEAQLLRLQGNSGTALSPNIKLAIVRVQ